MYHTVDGRNPMIKYAIIYNVLYIPGGCLGFLSFIGSHIHISGAAIPRRVVEPHGLHIWCESSAAKSSPLCWHLGMSAMWKKMAIFWGNISKRRGTKQPEKSVICHWKSRIAHEPRSHCWWLQRFADRNVQPLYKNGIHIVTQTTKFLKDLALFPKHNA